MLPARRNNQTWIPDIFNDFFDNTWMERPKATAPAINVLDTKDAYLLELAAPGMTKQDFNVHLDEDGDLVINMDHKEAEKKEEHTHYLRREFSYTNYEQSYTLPEDVESDQIAARVENGILTVTLPKKAKEEPKKLTRQIEVG